MYHATTVSEDMAERTDMAKNTDSKNEKQSGERISFLHSITAKIMLLVLVCLAVTVTVCTLIFIRNAKGEITDVTMRLIDTVTKSERDLLNRKTPGEANTEFYANALGNITVEASADLMHILSERTGRCSIIRRRKK